MFRRNALNKSPLIKQRGVSLIMAIFMIIIFSLMAAALVKMMRASSESISYEVIGTRAYNTADIGNQWALQQLFPLGTSVTTCSEVDISNAPTVRSTPGLIDCFIDQLSCSSFVESGVTYFTISSTGVCQVGSVSTSRTLQIDARSM